ncbi:MAG: DUF4199 domain-containing protein, partial [Bacteroidia bacterium]
MKTTGLFQINFVRWGLILGGVAIFFLIAINTILGVDWLIYNYLTGRLLMYTITFFLITNALISKRKLNDGYISYGSCFLEGIFVFMIGSIIKISFEYVYINLISPESIQIIKRATIDSSVELYEKFKVPQKDIN